MGGCVGYIIRRQTHKGGQRWPGLSSEAQHVHGSARHRGPRSAPAAPRRPAPPPPPPHPPHSPPTAGPIATALADTGHRKAVPRGGYTIKITYPRTSTAVANGAQLTPTQTASQPRVHVDGPGWALAYLPACLQARCRRSRARLRSPREAFGLLGASSPEPSPTRPPAR